jgi:chromosome segregation protein
LRDPGGDIVSRQSVTLFAPDSAAHGLLERQREIDALAAVIASVGNVVQAQACLGAVEGRLAEAQQACTIARSN